MKAVNLLLRFLLELCALAAIAYWGYHAAQNDTLRLALSIAAPLALAILWGLFAAHKAKFPPSGVWKDVVGFLFLESAAVALALAGQATLAGIFAVRQYRQALANVRFAKGDYAGALEAYTAALAGAGKATVTPALKDAMAAMYTGQANAYLKLKRNAEAVQAYTQAAQLASHPATALFNLCAVQYNLGNVDAALSACDKAIAADPTKADAYFIKGSLLTGGASMDTAGKVTAPPGAVEALQKYLELAPSGPHAADVKQMLDFLTGKSP